MMRETKLLDGSQIDFALVVPIKKHRDDLIGVDWLIWEWGSDNRCLGEEGRGE